MIEQMGRRGFTLIELLVVISIISLLSSVVLTSIQSAREKAWDARASSDIRQYRIAMENYRNDHDTYPQPAVNWNSVTNQQICLGDYSNDKCLESTFGFYSERSEINAALIPYFSELPSARRSSFSVEVPGLGIPYTITDGYTYGCSVSVPNTTCTGGVLYLKWLLRGPDVICPYGANSLPSGESTFCLFYFD